MGCSASAPRASTSAEPAAAVKPHALGLPHTAEATPATPQQQAQLDTNPKEALAPAPAAAAPAPEQVEVAKPKETTPAAAPTPEQVALARLKLVFAGIQANSEASLGDDSLDSTAVGLPDIQPKLVKQETLPDRIGDLDDGMKKDMRNADMRLLRISSALSWDHLQVYEDIKAEDLLQQPYKKVSAEVWAKTLVLSWRWGNDKPLEQTPGWSPATPVQWQELKAVLQHALGSGMEHVWIDWCCMPQYSADTMMEVMRSKVYYVRAGAMTVLPTFNDLPDGGPVCILLKKASRILKRAAGEGAPDGGMIEATVAAVLDALLEKGQVAGREYFGRAWTLAERMARHGRKERLCQWMSLEAWIGMIVDAMLKSTEDKMESQEKKRKENTTSPNGDVG